MWDDGTLNTNGKHLINLIVKYDYTILKYILNTTEPTHFSSQHGKIKSPINLSLASLDISQ